MNAPFAQSEFCLVSLLDMLRFYAEPYLDLAALLEEIVQKIDHLLKRGEPDKGVGDLGASAVTSLLKDVADGCSAMSLQSSAIHANRLIRYLDNKAITYAEMATSLGELRVRIQDDLSQTLLMRIPAERASLYDQPQLFGLGVADAFPSAKFDIWEAGNCFAAGRFTASVFHLMRVLEIGLSAFAVVFNVPSDHTNWHNIIEGIESKVRDMGKDPNKQPDWKENQEFYSQAANSFMFFKDAWRNYTAHARGKYVEHEADTILRNVRAFMQKLADGGIQETLTVP